MAMVLHEEQRSMSSNNSNSGSGGAAATAGGARSTKKNKQRKTPQRGMGVAQLEELRIREQQKKSSAAAPASTQQQFLTTAAEDPNPLSRIPSNAINFFGHSHNPVPPPPPLPSANCADRGFLDLSPGNMMEPLPPHDSEARKYNQFASVHDCANPGGWRPSGLVQRRQQNHQHFSMADKKLLSSSSSGVNFQIEPPSNQSYRSNYHIPPSWPDEEKVVGIKRPWPFHPDSFSGHGAFPCRVPVLRESTSSSSTNHVDSYHCDKSRKENGVRADDAFLTLGPYLVPSISGSRFPPSLALDFASWQGSTDDGLSQSGISSEPHFYSFLPMAPESHETNSNGRRGEALDSVDLNLKL